jgi:septal ring factor EnvC (AmiA/AmiB activator)
MKIFWLTVQLVLLALFGWGTFLQIENQKSTNEVMAKVKTNIQRARELTRTTNQQLAPLEMTGTTIEQMNNKLSRTHQTLSVMNSRIQSVIQSEQKIVSGLDNLNKKTAQVAEELKSISDTNRPISSAASGLANQTNGENRLMETLSALTDESIRQLRTLNRKMAWLGLLP